MNILGYAHRQELEVEVSAFKLTRQASMLKHTGVVLRITSNSKNLRTEWLGEWIHEVSGGRTINATKADLKTRRRQPDDDIEEEKLMTKFVVDFEELDEFESLFEYRHDYNLVLNNCRDHVLAFAARLEAYGLQVSQDAKDFIKGTQVKDALVVGGLIGGAVFGIAYLTKKLFSVNNSEEEKKNKQQEPEHTLLQ